MQRFINYLVLTQVEIYLVIKTKIKFNGKNKSMKVYIGGKKYVREKLTKIKSNVYYVKGSAIKIKFFHKKIRVYALMGVMPKFHIAEHLKSQVMSDILVTYIIK